MKNLTLFLLLCLPVSLLAQNSFSLQDLKYFNQVLGEDDEDFEVTKVPAEFADEPVVSLCQKLHFSFLAANSGHMSKGVIRKRIKIQDKSVLSDFSEYYYQNSSALGLKHVKPDGTINKIPLDEGIEVKTQVPKYYRSSYNRSSYYKTTIPNLEVGDILDYYEVISENFSGIQQLISPITASYPIVKQDIIFEVDKAWTVYVDTYNNAPPFVEDKEGGLNKRGKVKKSIKRLVLSSTNLPAQKDERWSYSNLNEPGFKIMILNAATSGRYVAINNSTIQNDVSLDGLFARFMLPVLNTSEINAIVKKYFRTIDIEGISSEKKRVAEIYSGIKAGFFEAATDRKKDQYYSMREEYFTHLFLYFLKLYDIPAQYVVGCPRYIGHKDDILTPQEMLVGVYVPSIKKYYWPMDNYSVAGEPNQSVTGTKAVVADPKKFKRGKAQFEEVSIPPSKATNNQSITNIDMKVTNNKLDMACEYEFTGAFKSNYHPLIVSNTYHLEKECDTFRTEKEIERNKKKKKTIKERELLEERKKTKGEVAKAKDEKIENWFKSDFDIDEFDSYKITSLGTTSKKPTIKINANFSSEKYIKKAGPNLIFELGRLIGSQVQLEEEEINNRKTDINLNYAKTIVNNFNITLPDGVKAQGIDAFNMNIDNKSGAFVSTATQDGNILKVKTTKTYKKQDMSKSEWPNMVEMLEAAYKFSQLKMVLK